MIFSVILLSVLLSSYLSTAQVAKSCYRENYGRVGESMTPQCLANEDVYGAMCYPKCKAGFESVGCCNCRRASCNGLQQSPDGSACVQYEPYGRPGYPWRFGDPLNDSRMYERCEADYGKNNCEKWGAVVYPKCKPNFYVTGCCLCSPICPDDTYPLGILCVKKTYARGTGTSRLDCSPGKQKDTGLCYPSCKSGMTGIGPVCWGQCPKNLPFNCGIVCAENAAECNKLKTATSSNAVLAKSLTEGGTAFGKSATAVKDSAAAVTELKNKFKVNACS